MRGYLIAALILLSACMTEEEREEEKQKEACIASGREVMQGGLSGWFCGTAFEDGGQSCRVNDDCAGQCVFDTMASRRGQCAPVSPVLGCYVGITDDGEKFEICVD